MMEHQGVQQALLDLSQAMGPTGLFIGYVILSYVGTFFIIRNSELWRHQLERDDTTDEDPPSTVVFGIAPLSFPVFVVYRIGWLVCNTFSYIIHLRIERYR